MKKLITITLTVFVLSSCLETNPGENIDIVGLKPIYASLDIEQVQSLPPRDFEELGNIVLYQSYIYIVEQFEGVHVLDNTDPSNPLNLGFINIPGVSQITIDEDILFANFGFDLILINIKNPLEITVDNIILDFYNFESEDFVTEDYFGSFECPDPSKGTIVGWVERSLFNPQCWK